MRRPGARVLGLVLGVFQTASGTLAAEKTRPPARPHVEIVAKADVASALRRTTGKNGRRFLEFEITLAAYVLAPEQPPGADRKVAVDMQGKVKVLHDLACGGDDIALAPGDRVELQGEYVDISGGPDLIRFTHAASAKAGCGGGSDHPDGYLRKVEPVTPAPAVTPPRPAVIVPDQPYFGTPSAGEKPHAAILKLKQSGASDEKLLETIRAGNRNYALSIQDIQDLRAAGMSPGVIEAMLQSGRSALTPRPTLAPSPAP